VIDILSDIKRGTLAPKSLDAETRIRCVEYLSAEGASVSEIAQLLGRTERTIRRDLDKVRAEHSLVIDDGFAPGLAGELLHESRAAIGRIRRVTREKDCPHAARIDGERATIEILDRTLARLQSLGFLPTVPRGLRTEVMHHLGDPIAVADLAAEARRLRECGAGAREEPMRLIEAIAIDLDAIDAESGSRTSGANSDAEVR
jgi:transposase